MEGKNTGEGKSGEPGEGGVVMIDGPLTPVPGVEGEVSGGGLGDEGGTATLKQLLVRPALAKGFEVVLKHDDVPVGLARSSLKTRYGAITEMSELEEDCVSANELEKTWGGYELSVEEVVVIPTSWLHDLLEKLELLNEIALSEDSK